MGAMMVTKAVWPLMKAQNFGRIVMTTSPSGLFGNFGQTNYGAAKLGLVGFMNTLKIEGAKNNIHTNAIAPVALTRMTENLIPEEAGKNLGPELITPAVTFLCSDDAPNGVVVQAAGGFLRGRHRGEHRGQPWRRGQGGRCGRGLVPDHGPHRGEAAQHAGSAKERTA